MGQGHALCFVAPRTCGPRADDGPLSTASSRPSDDHYGRACRIGLAAGGAFVSARGRWRPDPVSAVDSKPCRTTRQWAKDTARFPSALVSRSLAAGVFWKDRLPWNIAILLRWLVLSNQSQTQFSTAPTPARLEVVNRPQWGPQPRCPFSFSANLAT